MEDSVLSASMEITLKSWIINPLSANPTKWSNTLKQFVGKLPTNCLSVSNHFVGLALKGLRMLHLSIYIIKVSVFVFFFSISILYRKGALKT